jgi:hypothetical protein
MISTTKISASTFVDIESFVNSDSAGLQYTFETAWVVWVQKKKSHSWEEDGLTALYRFKTIAGFWFVFETMKFHEGCRFIFMRDGIKPIFEDANNTAGGYCRIILNKINYHDIFLNCLLALIGETLTKQTYDSFNITGLTYINEAYTKQLRIWIRDKEHPLGSDVISNGILDLISEDADEGADEGAGVDVNANDIFTFVTFDHIKNRKYPIKK